MKKIILLILILPILAISQECQTYTDISNSTYKNDILYASNVNWITCKTTFRPTEKTNKIEALKMALLAGGHTNIPEEDPRECFADIPTTGVDKWMNPFVCYGKDNDFLVKRDNFNPAIEIDFAKASKLILKALTNESYSENGTEWYDDYLAKMALYGFRLNPTATINRDYFIYMLREIKKDPTKQPEVIPPVVVPPIVIPPVVVPPIVDVVGESAISGFSDWFTPYRCFDSIAPSLELKIKNDSIDSANNRILDLEYDTNGGTQSCIDTEGEGHSLAFGTRWRAEGLKFTDLTSKKDKPKYKYKKVRVTISSGQSTKIRLSVITTLGKVMVKTLFIDESGKITTNKTIIYGLNSMKISDPNILSKIKLLIADLKSIKLELEALLSNPRSEKKVNDDKNDLKHRYDAVKKRIDKAKKLLKNVKKALKGHKDKKALEQEIKKIDKALNAIKKKINRYKKSKDNSAFAIDSLKSAIDDVIAMMVSESSDVVGDTVGVNVPKGRSTISGAIDVSKLSDEIYAVWIVDGGNWYGYSPDASVRKDIQAKYRLIEGIIPPYKATIVWALEDTFIAFENTKTVANVTQSYGKGFSIHGTNNMNISVDEVLCNHNKRLTGLFTVKGDKVSVSISGRKLDNWDNFDYLYGNEGYYSLCE